MHELTVTENILEIALRHAASAQARKITSLYLVIGQLSSIIDDSVQFYWDIISKGTLAAGASLYFQRIAVEMACQKCNHHYSPPGEDFACPECGSTIVKPLAGEEFYLEAIDVET
jgi:hydrogenase nickel incorporation protein HypA/HybF